MSTVPMPQRFAAKNDYPTWSPEPMPETDWHRILMNMLIDTLAAFYAGQQVYVAGNNLVFYEEGDRRRHISPDVWLARGVEPMLRENFLIWEEARGPEFVIELTSATTAEADRTTKFELYRDVLRVREYFLFDPREDYLEPRLQGYRLSGNTYQRIRPRNGRLPSRITGLHLESDGIRLQLWNPQTGAWLPTPIEAAEARVDAIAEERDAIAEERDAIAEERDAIAEERDAVAEERDAEKARANDALAENERLRRQLAQLTEKRNGHS